MALQMIGKTAFLRTKVYYFSNNYFFLFAISDFTCTFAALLGKKIDK